MADGAIAPVPIEDDTASALGGARLSGERFWDSTIDNTVVRKLVVTVGCAAQGEGYQHCRQQAWAHRSEPTQVKTSAVILAYHDCAYSASRCRTSLGASTGLIPSEPSTAVILSPTTR